MWKLINVIQAERRAYYRQNKFMMRKRINREKETGMRLYKAMIRPVLTYAVETLSMTKKDDEKLRIFECGFVRKRLSPVAVNEEGSHIMMTHEIAKIIQVEDVVRIIKSQ